MSFICLLSPKIRIAYAYKMTRTEMCVTTHYTNSTINSCRTRVINF